MPIPLTSVVDFGGWLCRLEPLPDPSKFSPRDGENEKLAARRRNADVQAEYNAVTGVAIYMLVMQFSQKGIDELRKYQEHMEMRHPEGDFVFSEGFDEGAPSCVNLYVASNPD
jgi:serine/threonine-protein kinase ULK/ATG1